MEFSSFVPSIGDSVGSSVGVVVVVSVLRGGRARLSLIGEQSCVEILHTQRRWIGNWYARSVHCVKCLRQVEACKKGVC